MGVLRRLAGKPWNTIPLYSSYSSRKGEISYKYVNDKIPGDSFTEITDRAATTLLWTELMRGEF